jgi:hypothetical protein
MWVPMSWPNLLTVTTPKQYMLSLIHMGILHHARAVVYQTVICRSRTSISVYQDMYMASKDVLFILCIVCLHHEGPLELVKGSYEKIF